MVNTKDFAKRLQMVINYYGESASSFAEKIGVQRSSISHILSGRNKPSLDFVLKVLAAFAEVELYWLLNGKGEFPANKKTEETPTPDVTINTDLFTEHNTLKEEKPQAPDTLKSQNNKIIERIVIFYSDGSFKNYEN